MTGALWKSLYCITEKRHSRGRFLTFITCVKEHETQRISSDDNSSKGKKNAADVEPKGSGRINSMPSKILMERALHQTYPLCLRSSFLGCVIEGVFPETAVAPWCCSKPQITPSKSSNEKQKNEIGQKNR